MTEGSSTSALKRLVRLSWSDRLLLAEAGFWLAAARSAVIVLPFRVLARRLGTHMAESPDGDGPSDLSRIGWAIRAVAARTPWRSMCLEQALAAKGMLRRRGIPNTLYLGVSPPRPDVRPSPFAHAWLRSGRVHVTGGANVSAYGVVSSFADLPDRWARSTG